MIQRRDILSIPYLKKAKFTGSFQGMRYRLEKAEVEMEPEEEGKEAVKDTRLLATFWEGPYSFDVVPAEKREVRDFPFSEEGICEATDWLNEAWCKEPKRWQEAQSRW